LTNKVGVVAVGAADRAWTSYVTEGFSESVSAQFKGMGAAELGLGPTEAGTVGGGPPPTPPMTWSEASAEHALNRHSPHRPPGPEGVGTQFPEEWSEPAFLDAVQEMANSPTTKRTPVPPERGGVGSTAYEPITIAGVTRRIFAVLEVPDPNIPGTGPGKITSAFPRHKNK
jgi:hypothetical protein